MYKFTLRRAALVVAVAFSTTFGFCALAEYAKAQSCLQWHCVWVNANTANPQQQCVCVQASAPPVSSPWGPYASDAPVDFLKPYR